MKAVKSCPLRAAIVLFVHFVLFVLFVLSVCISDVVNKADIWGRNVQLLLCREQGRHLGQKCLLTTIMSWTRPTYGAKLSTYYYYIMHNADIWGRTVCFWLLCHEQGLHVAVTITIKPRTRLACVAEMSIYDYNVKKQAFSALHWQRANHSGCNQRSSNSKQKSTNVALLLVERQPKVCTWKNLHTVLHLWRNCIFTWCPL